MKRACFVCGTLRDEFKYSENQWSKGIGESKCKTCEETEDSSSARLAMDIPSQSPADTIHEQSEFEPLALFVELALQTDNREVRDVRPHLLCSPELLRGHTHSHIDTFFAHSYLLALTGNTDTIDGDI